MSKGANIEAKDKSGYTPLILASMNGRLLIVEYFISKGANIEAKNNDRYTPLLIASANGHQSTDVPS